MRNGFTAKIKNIVATRAGFRCSNPSCQLSTSGPHPDPKKAVNIGVVAHITAVSPAGPRYDPTLAREACHAIENAIWLCQNCARLIDYDPDRYSAELLRQWKDIAECVAQEALSTFEDVNWPRDIKAQCLNLLTACDHATDNASKGRVLEDLIEILFTSDNTFVFSEKRASTGDEEIDLVFINNITRPFWMALNSPLIFVECKNWNKHVGTKELRDFEVKLQNHVKLAKVGFFVSLNGFSTEVSDELKRMGRSEYHIVLIERDDIVMYLTTEIDFLDWLEKRVSKLY